MIHSIGPIVTLLTLALLPELVTASTPLTSMIAPGVLLWFLLTYGLPILLLREWSIRRGVTTVGLFVWGLAYGLVNEGLLAGTLSSVTTLPMPDYTGYGVAFGLNWGFLMVIVSWHAFMSVVLPITLTHILWRGMSSVPWINSRLASVFAFVFICLTTLVVIDPALQRPQIPALLCVLMVGGLLFVGAKIRGIPSQGGRGVFSTTAFLLGVSILLTYFIFFTVLIKNGVPFAVFSLVVVASCIGYFWWLFRLHLWHEAGIASFALGALWQQWILSVFILSVTSQTALLGERVVVAGILVVVTFFLYRHLRTKSAVVRSA